MIEVLILIVLSVCIFLLYWVPRGVTLLFAKYGKPIIVCYLFFLTGIALVHAGLSGYMDYRRDKKNRAKTEADRDKKHQDFLERRKYHSLVCGDRLLANRGNDDGLEVDDTFFYFTHDNGRDLTVWRFARSKNIAEQEVVDAFHDYPKAFREWLMEKGIEDEDYDWVNHKK